MMLLTYNYSSSANDPYRTHNELFEVAIDSQCMVLIEPVPVTLLRKPGKQ